MEIYLASISNTKVKSIFQNINHALCVKEIIEHVSCVNLNVSQAGVIKMPGTNFNN